MKITADNFLAGLSFELEQIKSIKEVNSRIKVIQTKLSDLHSSKLNFHSANPIILRGDEQLYEDTACLELYIDASSRPFEFNVPEYLLERTGFLPGECSLRMCTTLLYHVRSMNQSHLLLHSNYPTRIIEDIIEELYTIVQNSESSRELCVKMLEAVHTGTITELLQAEQFCNLRNPKHTTVILKVFVNR